MYKKNIVFLIFLVFILESCETFGQVKRGLSGEKEKSTDEFMVKKKDPLILPPNYSDLPSPDKVKKNKSETLIFQSESESGSSAVGSSTEQSILNKIKKK